MDSSDSKIFNFVLNFNCDYNPPTVHDEMFRTKFVIPIPKPGVGSFIMDAIPFKKGETFSFNEGTPGVNRLGSESGDYFRLPFREELETLRLLGDDDEFPKDLNAEIKYNSPTEISSEATRIYFNLISNINGGGKSKKRKRRKSKRRKSKRRKSKRRKSKTRRRRR